MKRVYANPKVCINCHLCQVYCITAHSRSRELIKAYQTEQLQGTARVVVEERKPNSFGLQCRHCKEPKCVASCISGAMRRDPDSGIVYCDSDRCVGCLTCVAACTFGAIRPGPDGKALKCDLCRGLDEPACVANCPNLALVFETRGEEQP